MCEKKLRDLLICERLNQKSHKSFCDTLEF